MSRARLRRSRRDVLLGAARLGAGSLLLDVEAALAARAQAQAAPLKIATARQTVSPGRTLTLYMAVPGRAHGRHAAVLVAHGDLGLDDTTRALARRVAQLGYVACAPDFLTRAGGTPMAEREVLGMMRRLDVDQAVADALGTMQWLGRNPPGERVLSGRVAALGTGWGGALVERLTTVAGGAMAGGVILSDPEPTSSDAASPVPLLHAAPDELGWSRIDTFLKEHLT